MEEMDWLTRQMWEQNERLQAASRAAAAESSARAAQAQAARAAGQMATARKNAFIAETTQGDRELLGQLGVIAMAGDVRSQHWHDGRIVRVEENPTNDPGSRSVRTFFGLEYEYDSLKEVMTDKTVTVRGEPFDTSGPFPGYGGAGLPKATYKKTAKTRALDGIFVGFRTEFDDAFDGIKVKGRELIVRSVRGLEAGGRRFAPAYIGDTVLRDVMSIRIEGPITPSILAVLRDRVHRAIADDTVRRRRDNRLPATVARIQSNIVRNAVDNHNDNIRRNRV